jgi:AraC-like DNA-binding protein
LDDSIFIRQAFVIDALSFDCLGTNPFSFQLHKHDQFCEMLLINEGLGTFSVDGKTYEAGPRTVLIYHAGIWHEELSRSYPFHAVFIAFRGLKLKYLPPGYFLEPDREPVIRLDSEEQFQSLYKLAEEIALECHGGGFEYKTVSNQLFGILLARLAKQVHGPEELQTVKRRPQEPIYRARRYIEENYDQDITLSKLASHCYMNAYHLAHKFKEEVGVSPIRFLIEYRIEVAKRYFLTTDLSIREIGELVGYRSETSFHHMFRKVTGMTPGQYRNKGQPIMQGEDKSPKD